MIISVNGVWQMSQDSNSGKFYRSLIKNLAPRHFCITESPLLCPDAPQAHTKDRENSPLYKSFQNRGHSERWVRPRTRGLHPGFEGIYVRCASPDLAHPARSTTPPSQAGHGGGGRVPGSMGWEGGLPTEHTGGMPVLPDITPLIKVSIWVFLIY
jgi:hypothetical protein